MPEINLLIFNELKKERETLGCKELETKVGLLHEALSSIGAKSYQPKDPEATVPVPLKLIFNKVSCPRKTIMSQATRQFHFPSLRQTIGNGKQGE